MKIFAVAVMTIIIILPQPARTQQNVPPAATMLWKEVVAAGEAGDEALRASLLQRMRDEFPGQYCGGLPPVYTDAEVARPAEHAVGSLATGATQFHTVPPAYTSTPGTVTFTGPLANTARTYQLLIQASQLAGIVGRNLTGLSWRLPSSATSNWPTADLTFTNYDVYLSGSVEPASRSFTFVDNIVGPQTQVRNTALTVLANDYTFGGSPNAWGSEILFTAPYLYSGGNLLVEIRHAGFTGTSRSVDAIGTTVSGYGTLFSGTWQSGYTATSGVQGNFSVVRLTTEDSTAVSVGEEGSGHPTLAGLDQNYPNPLNPSTSIRYKVPASGFIQLKVFDPLGREVATLVNQMMEQGTHEVTWDAKGFASGVYLYRLNAGLFVETKKLILMR